MFSSQTSIGDGHLDLVTQHLLSSSVALLSGDGKGHFASFDGAPMRLGYQPGAITIGDVNHDGILDLGVTSRDDNSEYVHVLLGNGRGSFKPVSGSPFTVSASAKTYKPSLQFVDVNEDGNLDIVAANGRRNTIEILFGDGRGAILAPLGREVGARLQQLFVRSRGHRRRWAPRSRGREQRYRR